MANSQEKWRVRISIAVSDAWGWSTPWRSTNEHSGQAENPSTGGSSALATTSTTNPRAIT